MSWPCGLSLLNCSTVNASNVEFSDHSGSGSNTRPTILSRRRWNANLASEQTTKQKAKQPTSSNYACQQGATERPQEMPYMSETSRIQTEKAHEKNRTPQFKVFVRLQAISPWSKGGEVQLRRGENFAKKTDTRAPSEATRLPQNWKNTSSLALEKVFLSAWAQVDRFWKSILATLDQGMYSHLNTNLLNILKVIGQAELAMWNGFRLRGTKKETNIFQSQKRIKV